MALTMRGPMALPDRIAERALRGEELDFTRVNRGVAAKAFVVAAGTRSLYGENAPRHDAALAGLRSRAASVFNLPQRQFGLREALQQMVSPSQAKDAIKSLNQNQTEALSTLFSQGLSANWIEQFLTNPAIEGFGGAAAVLDLIYACRLEGVDNLRAPFIPQGVATRLQSTRPGDIDLEISRLQLALQQAQERPKRLNVTVDATFPWSLSVAGQTQRAALDALDLSQTKFGDLSEHTFVKVTVAALGAEPKLSRLGMVVSPRMLSGAGLKLSAAQIIRVANVVHHEKFGLFEFRIRLDRSESVSERDLDFLKRHLELGHVPYRLIISRAGGEEEIIASSQASEVVKASDVPDAPVRMPWNREIKDVLQEMIPIGLVNVRVYKTFEDFERAVHSQFRSFDQEDVANSIEALLGAKNITPESRGIIESELAAFKREKKNTLSYATIRRLLTIALAFVTVPVPSQADTQAQAYRPLQHAWEDGVRDFIAKAQFDIADFVELTTGNEDIGEVTELWDALQFTPDTRFMIDAQGDTLLSLREVLQLMRETALVVDWSERVAGMMRDYIARYDAIAALRQSPELVISMTDDGEATVSANFSAGI